MLLKVSLLVLLAVGSLASPVPDPQSDKGLGSALGAAGAGQDKFQCECQPVPSDDGVRTLKCHCVSKGASGGGDSGAGGAGGNGKAGTEAPAGTPAAAVGTTPAAAAGTTPAAAAATTPAAAAATTPAAAAGTTPGAAAATTPAAAAGTTPAAAEGTSPAAAAAADTLNNKEYGNDKAYVTCQKKGTSWVSSKPDWDWLKADGDKGVTIRGSWVTVACGYGKVKAFKTSAKAMKTAEDMCTKKGYETAQPADRANSLTNVLSITDTLDGYYAFQGDDQLGAYYSEEKGWVSNGYTKREGAPANKC